jgi:hypothetical protein
MNRPNVAPLALVPLLLLALLPTGCGTTPPSRFYALEALPEAARPAADAGGLAIDIGPIVLSDGLDRPQMITRLGPHELALHDYSRWAEPLGDNIARVLAENLAVLAHTERVGIAPEAETHEPSWRVTAQLLRCEGAVDGSSLLVVRWRLYGPGESTPSTTRKSSFSTPLPTPDAAGIAAALSADLADLAREIAKALPAS